MNSKRFVRLIVFGMLFLFVTPIVRAESELNTTPFLDEDHQIEFYEDGFVGPLPYVGPRIVINVAARELHLYDDNGLIKTLKKTYPIAVGSPIYRTPIGQRWLREITWNPAWYPPKSKWAEESKITPPGPYNPLGRVKMNLGKAILIHGTNKPWSIGKAASHGCLRMKNDTALELAQYIQTAITEFGTEENFSKYNQRMYRSFPVKLSTWVPVDIVYEPVQLKEGELYVYRDIYGKLKNKMNAVKTQLAEQGYDTNAYDLAKIEKLLRKSRRKDMVFNLKEYSFEHQEQMAKDDSPKNLKRASS